MLCFLSCEHNPAAVVTDYEISEIYGYTFYGNITASSGNSLIPSLIIYDENRCDWNMNTSGMNNNQFYYYSVKNSAANYTLYWFTADNLCYCLQKDSSKASMTVQIGINGPSQLVILLTGDGLTNVSGMTNTRVPMLKQNIPQNTSPSKITFDSNVEDIKIEIPSEAKDAVWQGDSSYSGSYAFLVLGGNESYLAKGQGENVKVSVFDTNSSIPNTVTIKTHDVSYTEQMSICSFEVSQVQVKKYGEVYYLSKDSCTVTIEKEDGSSMTLNEVNVKGKLENGILTWRVSFKPGKMPFPIVEIFTSEN
ncbi:MAG: hypothetical protein K5829_09180 [Treponema sp.]|nr:hypothetical protein [Treponema sp.]